MARVTVEDCVVKIPNRFDLVLLSAQRARAVSAGAPLTIERDNDKNPVIALREIAEETVQPDELMEAAIHGLRKHAEVDEPEEDDMAMLMAGGDRDRAIGGIDGAADELAQALGEFVAARTDGVSDVPPEDAPPEEGGEQAAAKETEDDAPKGAEGLDADVSPEAEENPTAPVEEE